MLLFHAWCVFWSLVISLVVLGIWSWNVCLGFLPLCYSDLHLLTLPRSCWPILPVWCILLWSCWCNNSSPFLIVWGLYPIVLNLTCGSICSQLVWVHIKIIQGGRLSLIHLRSLVVVACRLIYLGNHLDTPLLCQIIWDVVYLWWCVWVGYKGFWITLWVQRCHYCHSQFLVFDWTLVLPALPSIEWCFLSRPFS